MTALKTSIRDTPYRDLTPEQQAAVDAELAASARVRTLERQHADVKRALAKARLSLVEAADTVDRMESGR